MWQKPDDVYGNLPSMGVKWMRYQEHVNDKVLAAMMEAYGNALTAHNVVLSQPERTRLFKKAMTQLLNELLSDQK